MFFSAGERAFYRHILEVAREGRSALTQHEAQQDTPEPASGVNLIWFFSILRGTISHQAQEEEALLLGQVNPACFKLLRNTEWTI